MDNTELKKVDYSRLVSQISETFVQGQQKAVCHLLHALGSAGNQMGQQQDYGEL